ncbi:MAG TPA: hypothetical protein VM223_01840 [Planctomycetota bacterium]|nr:hypothetical protein [Planctomycetota bacterium]
MLFMQRTVLAYSLVALTAACALSGPQAQQDIVIGEDGLQPQSLDIDAQGNIYVGGGQEVWVYDAAGNRTQVWQFGSAKPVRVGPDGNLYIGRTWEPNTQIRVLDGNGQYIRSIGTNKWMHGDAIGFDVPFDACPYRKLHPARGRQENGLCQ